MTPGSRSWARARPRCCRAYPHSGWVEHDPDALLRSVGPQVTRALDESGVRADRHRGHRPDQPARDDDRLGAGDRQGHRAGPGLAGPADGPGLRSAQGPPGVGLRAHRPGHRPVLLRHQDRLDPGQRPRGPPPRPGRRAGRGDGGQLPGLAPDRRADFRHRRDQCLPNAAHGPQDPPLGGRSLRIIRSSARNIARDPSQLGRIRPDLGPALPPRRPADPGNRRRPAGVADRPGLRRGRPGQMYLSARVPSCWPTRVAGSCRLGAD